MKHSKPIVIVKRDKKGNLQTVSSDEINIFLLDEDISNIKDGFGEKIKVEENELALFNFGGNVSEKEIKSILKNYKGNLK